LGRRSQKKEAESVSTKEEKREKGSLRVRLKGKGFGAQHLHHGQHSERGPFESPANRQRKKGKPGRCVWTSKKTFAFGMVAEEEDAPPKGTRGPTKGRRSRAQVSGNSKGTGRSVIERELLAPFAQI